MKPQCLEFGESWACLKSSKETNVLLKPEQLEKLKLTHLDAPLNRAFFHSSSAIDFAWGAHVIPENCSVRLSSANNGIGNQTFTCAAQIHPSLWSSLTMGSRYTDMNTGATTTICLVKAPVDGYTRRFYERKSFWIFGYAAYQSHDPWTWYPSLKRLASHYTLPPFPNSILFEEEKSANNCLVFATTSLPQRFSSQAKETNSSLGEPQYSPPNPWTLFPQAHVYIFTPGPQNIQQLNLWTESLVWATKQVTPLVKQEEIDLEGDEGDIVEWSDHEYREGICAAMNSTVNLTMNSTIDSTMGVTGSPIDSATTLPVVPPSSWIADLCWEESQEGLKMTLASDYVNSNMDGDLYLSLDSDYFQKIFINLRPHEENVGMIARATTASISRSVPVKCMSCSLQADVWCCDCNAFFCQRQCHATGHRLDLLNHHRLTPLPVAIKQESMIKPDTKPGPKSELRAPPELPHVFLLKKQHSRLHFLERLRWTCLWKQPSYLHKLSKHRPRFSHLSSVLLPDILSHPCTHEMVLEQLNQRLYETMMGIAAWRTKFPFDFQLDGSAPQPRLCLQPTSSFIDSSNPFNWVSKLPDCPKFIYGGTTDALHGTTMKLNCCSTTVSSTHLQPGQQLDLVNPQTSFSFLSRVLVLEVHVVNESCHFIITTCDESMQHIPNHTVYMWVGPAIDSVYLQGRDAATSYRLGLDAIGNRVWPQRLNTISTVQDSLQSQPNRFIYVLHPYLYPSERIIWAIAALEPNSGTLKIINASCRLTPKQLHRLKNLDQESNGTRPLRLILLDETGKQIDTSRQDAVAIVEW